jgi:hypothetical protein
VGNGCCWFYSGVCLGLASRVLSLCLFLPSCLLACLPRLSWVRLAGWPAGWLAGIEGCARALGAGASVGCLKYLGDVLANLALSLCSSRIVNLVVAVLMVLGGISQFFPIHLYVSLSRRKVCWVGECVDGC